MVFGLGDRTPTLRSHLTFWNTAVLLFIISVTLILLRQAFLWTMLGEMDHLLEEDAQEVALLMRSKYPTRADSIRETLDRKSRSHREDNWFVEIFHADGAHYLASPDAPSPDGEVIGSPTQQPFSWGGFRVVYRRLDGPELNGMTIRVGASLDGVEKDLTRLSHILLAAGLIIMVLAPLAGNFLAGRATRPLAAILKTTGRLRPDHLNERLPLHGTGDELDRLSGTINNFLDRLALHLSQQREFVANAAHELRSPLTALRTSVEIALERDRPGEEYRELLADLAEECTSLGTLVNQLLLLAESDAGQIHPGEAPLRLDQLARRSVEMFQGVAEQRDVVLECPILEPLTVIGHPTHLRQVIHNLIDNAIRFTPPGGTVRVEVRAGENAKGKLGLLTVRDSGVGIPPEHLPHVFERFYRADRSRQRDGGSGLGLCICRSIVHAYGGEIHIVSEPEKGTAVHVQLPAISNPI